MSDSAAQFEQHLLGKAVSNADDTISSAPARRYDLSDLFEELETSSC